MKSVAAIIVGLIIPAAAAAQTALPALTQSEAAQLVKSVIMGGPKCQFLPILGTYRVSAESPGILPLAKRYEKAGLVTITPVDQRTGNVWTDLQKMGQAGLSSVIKVEISPSADPSYFCETGPGRKGVIGGASSLRDVIRFEKVPGNVDGLPSEMYILQGLVDYQPSPVEKLMDPDDGAGVKIQVLFKYDYFRKNWYISTSQMVRLSLPFNAAQFDKARGVIP